MFNKKLVLSALAVALLATSGLSFSREASEGPRGADRVHTGTHKNSVDNDSMILARRGADDPVGSERPGEVHGQKRGGRNSVDSEIILTRRGADDPIPHPRGEGVGHPNSVDASEMILARRGADDPIPHPRGEGVGHPNSVEIAVLA